MTCRPLTILGEQFTPAALIRRAVDDLKWCIKQPDIEIDMNSWVNESNGVCRVCLAGSVLRRAGIMFESTQWDKESGCVFLDDLRCSIGEDEFDSREYGLLIQTMWDMDLLPWEVITFEADPDEFISTLEDIATKVDKAWPAITKVWKGSELGGYQ